MVAGCFYLNHFVYVFRIKVTFITQNFGGLYLEVSEGSGELSHVQSQAPGRASGAVDLLLNILLLR